jgi:hypothetical protein
MEALHFISLTFPIKKKEKKEEKRKDVNKRPFT